MRNVKRTIRASAKDVIADLAPPPQWIEPELCKLVTRIPAGDNWAHEIKFDGFRMHARIVSGAAALLTRNGLDWTAKYPDIAAAIGALNCRQAYLDGELCAVLPDGTTSFSALQGHGDAPAELVYFAFDLLHLDGEDLMRLPLLERKARLEALLAARRPCFASAVMSSATARTSSRKGRSSASKAWSRSRSTGPTCRATAASGSRPSFSTGRNS